MTGGRARFPIRLALLAAVVFTPAACTGIALDCDTFDLPLLHTWALMHGSICLLLPMCFVLSLALTWIGWRMMRARRATGNEREDPA